VTGVFYGIGSGPHLCRELDALHHNTSVGLFWLQKKRRHGTSLHWHSFWSIRRLPSSNNSWLQRCIGNLSDSNQNRRLFDSHICALHNFEKAVLLTTEVVAVAAAAFLVYFVKIKKPNNTSKQPE
jgi:hypothetical protein